MSFLKDMKERREQRRQEAEWDRLVENHREARAEWEQELAEARSALAAAEASAEDLIHASSDEVPILLKRGEFPIAVLREVGLVEMVRGRGSYQGGSQGVSFRVAKGVSYRVGGHRGTFVPGEEELKIVDQGTGVVTNQRVVFQGAGKTREWAFSKLIGVDHNAEAGLSMLHVSNRQKASGLAYGPDAAAAVEDRIELALAHFTGDIGDLRVALKSRVAEVEKAAPTPPLPPRPEG